MVFDKDMLRGFKFNLIDSEKTIHKVIKCPHCNSNLNIYEPITSPCNISQGFIIPEINEIGYWVEKCKQCHKLLKLKVHNPDLLKISYGNGDFYGFFIDEDYFELKNGIVLNAIKEVQEELVVKKIFKL